MSERRERDHIEDVEGQLEAAGALVESLEEEVVSLRRDLEQASVALRAAQEEVSAREKALEIKEQARQTFEREARGLHKSLAELRISSSEEQLELTNQHITELSRLQNRFYTQLWEKAEAALGSEDTETLKTEYQQVREEAERAYREQIEPLESSYLEARENLQQAAREIDRRREQELEALREETEQRLNAQEEQLRLQYEERLESELESVTRSHEEEIKSLRETVSSLEDRIREEYQKLADSQRTDSESGLRELEKQLEAAEERHNEELRKIKSLAENREQELRKNHAARLSETQEEAERRIEALQSQREADNRALREKHETELSRLREEQESDISFEEGAAERTMPWEAALVLQERVKELERSLSESERSREALQLELQELRENQADAPMELAPTGPDEYAEERLEELEAEVARRDEQIRSLEARLSEAQEEERRRAEELERASSSLRQFADPEHRLRRGIAEFNTSEHARHVASISKSLGLPRVHAGIAGEEPGKPVFTFVWEELAWRRYAVDPVEGVEEPRVYLIGSGDESEDTSRLPDEPNARVDAQGRLILGIKAR